MRERMTALIDTLLLFSLPASGKSEVRRYLGNLTPAQCRDDFGLGPTAQLDDYPYVHLMHRIDDELIALGYKQLYYKGPNRPFQDDWSWAVLIELLNEDFANLVAGKQVEARSAAQHLFDRLDAAHTKVGMNPHLGDIPWRLRVKLGEAVEQECRAEMDGLNRQAAEGTAGKTIVIEAARGGANGSAFPLSPPYGYDAAFQTLSPTILERASVLYIWVDPTESRRKNIERGRPDGQGSILHHSVPMEVMLGQYGTDDMDWLLSQSDRPGSIRVERVIEKDGKYTARTFHLPFGRLDNRVDLTTFVRVPKDQWAPADVKKLHEGLGEGFAAIRRGAAAR
jgi:hypothetical protein